MGNSRSKRLIGRLLTVVALLLGLTATSFVQPAAAATSYTTVSVGNSGGSTINIYLKCGGKWKSVPFYYGATSGDIRVKPKGGSGFTFRAWDSNGKTKVTYTCSGSKTRVTYRYVGDVIHSGNGPV